MSIVSYTKAKIDTLLGAKQDAATLDTDTSALVGDDTSATSGALKAAFVHVDVDGNLVLTVDGVDTVVGGGGGGLTSEQVQDLMSTTLVAGANTTISYDDTAGKITITTTGGSGGGTAATVQVGTVTTGAAGSSAAVTNEGTTSAAVFDFVIPRGDTGATGPQGPAGADGAQGPKGGTGATGPAGPGLPAGGTAGQVPAKIDAADYNTHWVDPPTGTGGAVDSVNGYTGTVVLAASDVGAVATAAVGAASGVASLDAGGKVTQAQIPSVALTEFLGAVASQTAMLALTGQRGDWCTRTDLGTDWQLIADDPTQLSNWREHVYPASPVSSVNGRTGAVTTSSADITDASTVGKAVLTAADEPTARAAIGAGTSSFALPDQSGSSGKFLTTDGASPSWGTPVGGGAVSNHFLDVTAGQNLFVFGHSYATGAGAGSGFGYAQRLTKSQIWAANFNAAVAGSLVSDVAKKIWTYNFGGSPVKGFILVDAGANDFNQIGDSANWPGGADVNRDLMGAMVGALRADSFVPHTSGTATGTWTQTTDAATKTGSYRVTTTQNDYIDIPVTIPTGGGEVTVILQGLHGGVGATPAQSGGTTFTVTEGGTTLASGSTSYGGTSGGNAAMGVHITGLSAGAHTLRITNTGTGSLRVDSIAVGTAAPPTVILVGDPPAPSENANGAPTWKTQLQAVADDYSSPAGSVVLVDLTTNWDNARYITTTDNLHPNDRGHNVILDRVETAIAALGYRPGQNGTTPV